MDIKEVASKGGNATVKKYGKAYMKELSKKGVEARKKKDQTDPESTT